MPKKKKNVAVAQGQSAITKVVRGPERSDTPTDKTGMNPSKRLSPSEKSIDICGGQQAALCASLGSSAQEKDIAFSAKLSAHLTDTSQSNQEISTLRNNVDLDIYRIPLSSKNHELSSLTSNF